VVRRLSLLALLAGCSPPVGPPPAPAVVVEAPARAAPTATSCADPPPATGPSETTGLVPAWRADLGKARGRLLDAGALVVSHAQGGRAVSIDPETGATCALLLPAPGEGAAAIDPYSARSTVVRGMLVGPVETRVAAIDVRTGAVRWSQEVLAPDDQPDKYYLRDSLLAVDAGPVIAVSFRVSKKNESPHRFDEIVAGLDPATGAIVWRRVGFARPRGTPVAQGTLALAADGGHVLVRTPERLLALDPATGTEAWAVAWLGVEPSTLVAAHGRAVIAGKDHRLHVRDTRTGAHVADAALPGGTPTEVLVGPSSLFVALETAPGTAEIVALDATSGAIRWRRPAAYSIGELRADGDVLLSVEGDGRAWGLDPDTGTPRWGLTSHLPWGGVALLRMRAGGRRVLVPSGVLEAFDPVAGSRPVPMAPYLRWEVATQGDHCAPVAVSSIDREERVLWRHEIPDRLRSQRWGTCDLAELASYRRSPRHGPPWYDVLGISETSDAWVVADAGGLLVLRKQDGAVLLDAALPARDPTLFFDDGTFTLSGDPPCTGKARRARIFARCGDRFLFFNGSQAALLAPSPWRIETRGAFARATGRPGGRAATSQTTLQLGARTLELDGITYMR
jgi:outer membrane protein assembly factor BamB